MQLNEAVGDEFTVQVRKGGRNLSIRKMIPVKSPGDDARLIGGQGFAAVRRYQLRARTAVFQTREQRTHPVARQRAP